jgi:hypothetical protein
MSFVASKTNQRYMPNAENWRKMPSHCRCRCALRNRKKEHFYRFAKQLSSLYIVSSTSCKNIVLLWFTFVNKMKLSRTLIFWTIFVFFLLRLALSAEHQNVTELLIETLREKGFLNLSGASYLFNKDRTDERWIKSVNA